MYRWHQTKFSAINKGLVSKEPTGLRRWSTPGGLPYERDGDARRKIKETNLGVAQA